MRPDGIVVGLDQGTCSLMRVSCRRVSEGRANLVSQCSWCLRLLWLGWRATTLRPHENRKRCETKRRITNEERPTHKGFLALRLVGGLRGTSFATLGSGVSPR